MLVQFLRQLVDLKMKGQFFEIQKVIQLIVEFGMQTALHCFRKTWTFFRLDTLKSEMFNIYSQSFFFAS